MRWSKYYALSLAFMLVLSVACMCFYISRRTNERDNKIVADTSMQVDMKLEYTIQGEWEERLYEEYEMNRQRGSRKRSHLFWWIQIISEEDKQETAQTYGLDIPQLDFENHFYILSFGRKLNGVKYDTEVPSKSGGLYTEVEIDFSEDHPDEDIMFENEEGNFISRSNLMARNVYIYAMDKIVLMNTRVDYEDLISLNYNYTENNLTEMPLTYMGEVQGEWQEYEGFQTYTYNNACELRHEGVAWWYQIHGDWEWYQEIFHMKGQKFEPEAGKYIISLGRKIEHLWYSPYGSDHGYGKGYYAKAIFDMENYDPNAIYIYELEKGVNFIDTTLDGWELKQFNFVDVYDIINTEYGDYFIDHGTNGWKKVKKETDMIEICVEGFTMTYTPQGRKLTVDDFKDIELGDSMQDIEEQLGEADGWIGAGMLRPVYVLEDGRTVVCYFTYPQVCQDLRELTVYDGHDIDYVLKNEDYESKK